MDHVRLTKLLMMTTSSHDGEALAAIRKANAILKEAGVNWQEFLAGRLPSSARMGPPPPKRDAGPRPSAREGEDFHRAPEDERELDRDYYDNVAEINIMFERARRKVRPHSSSGRTVAGIKKWWEEHEYLTRKQYEALRKACR